MHICAIYNGNWNPVKQMVLLLVNASGNWVPCSILRVNITNYLFTRQTRQNWTNIYLFIKQRKSNIAKQLSPSMSEIARNRMNLLSFGYMKVSLAQVLSDSVGEYWNGMRNFAASEVKRTVIHFELFALNMSWLCCYLKQNMVTF